VAAAYRGEQEAPDKVLRLGSAIDVFLFACPVSLEYARRAGVLRVPATCVPLSGSALFAALLRACAGGRYDLSRVSVDVLGRGKNVQVEMKTDKDCTDKKGSVVK
jgi:hypothetical protein